MPPTPSLSDIDHIIHTEPLFNVESQLSTLRNLLTDDKILTTNVPVNIKQSLENIIHYFEGQLVGSAVENESSIAPVSSNNPQPVLSPLSQNIEVRRRVKVTRKITVDKLYIYHTPNTMIEYPETHNTERIGHLFAVTPGSDFNPLKFFAYSQGEPKGTIMGKKSQPPKSNLDSDSSIDANPSQPGPYYDLLGPHGITVLHRVHHLTCQGMKACPFVDQEKACIPHVIASREQLAERLKVLNSEERRKAISPSNQVFLKTLSYFSALKRLGCRSPMYESTVFTELELKRRVDQEQQRESQSRGHIGKMTCDGRLLFEYTANREPFIRCEHYDFRLNRDHFIDFTIKSGQLDTEYLEALFFDDKQALADLELDASAHGIGPRVPCTTICNPSSIKVNCLFDHRKEDGTLVNPGLVHLKCESNFRLYEPLEDFRRDCPWVLVICQGSHSHPIPIPSKTPPTVVDELISIITKTQEALPDLTPRRFLRHPVLKNFLQEKFPSLSNPMLLDVHPSLANRDHLRVYIDKVRQQLFPEGTGWQGLLHLKNEQDLLNHEKYIRFMGEYPTLIQADEEGDIDESRSIDLPLRVIVCMLKENSYRLLNEKFIQSDIGFKRIVGWKEFELGAQDAVSRITTTYCRVYTNRQTAEAHRIIFHKIDDIVREDTGQNLRWRHIHSHNGTAEGAEGILGLTVDLHGGQAKGFGLYLCDKAKMLPPTQDLHEAHRLLQELDEYDHLRRILRACVIHFLRKIQSCAVSENVKKKMRSLICIQHSSWNVTLREIEEEGGKAARDWVADKHRSKFAFPAVCWEKSYIPLSIWKAGPDNSNIIEQLHEDVNREGITCTLVGGVYKAHHFDMLKHRTLEATVSTGIHPGYVKGHISSSSSRSLQRKAHIHSKVLQKQDDTLQILNDKLQKAYDSKVSAEHEYLTSLDGSYSDTRIEQAAKKKEKASQTYEKALKMSLSGVGTGSGKVGILLPPDISHTR